MKVSIFVAPILLLAACGASQSQARGDAERENVQRIAAMEHGCARDRVIITDQSWGYPATLVLDVCGERRVYRDTAPQNARGFQWRDMTSGGEN